MDHLTAFDTPDTAKPLQRDPRRSPTFFSVLKQVTLQRDPQATSPKAGDIVQALGYFVYMPDHLAALKTTELGRCMAQQLRKNSGGTELQLIDLLQTPVPAGLRLTLSAVVRPLLARLLAVEPALQLRHIDVHTRWRAQHLFEQLRQAGRKVPGQEKTADSVAADLALQLVSQERRGSVRCLLHGNAAWGSTELAVALSDALVAHEGYTAMDIDCSNYRSEGEAASWAGGKAYWVGSSPGEVTSFIHQHRKAVIVFHRIDETLPKVMAALRKALESGTMVDGHGIDEPGRDDDGRRRKTHPTSVDAREAVFIFTAEHASEWLTHAQVDTVLGASETQRQGNLLSELRAASHEHRGETVPLFDATVLRAVAAHHHLLHPQPWTVLHGEAMAQWPHVKRLAHQNLGVTLVVNAPEAVSDLTALLLLSHGDGAALSHTRAEALYRSWLQALQTQRMGELQMQFAAEAGFLEVGLTPEAHAQWATLRTQLGDDPVKFLRRQRAFVGLSFAASDGAWTLCDLKLQPVRTLADYTGASGLISRVPDERLDDVCGHAEVKRHLRSVLAQLKAPEQLATYGIQPPRGVVLQGPPGTGKTLLARALAGEARLPFISITGTELLDPATLRRVYDIAHRNEPCVIHIDEADALGRRGGQSPVHDAAINFLLAKIDGFSQHVGVFHVLTTNRADELDSALTRPGRIEQRFEIGPLDREGRGVQLERLWHLLQVPDNQRAAAQQRILEQTYGMTGAELAQFHAEVVRHALGGRLDTLKEAGQAPLQVTVDVALSVLARLRFGDTSQRPPDDEGDRRLRAAVHEAGHALAHHLLLPQLPLAQVSIVPRGNVEGFVASGGENNRHLEETPSVIRAFLVMLLAGRAAEMLRFGSEGPNSGCTSDLAKATAAAYRAVAISGLDEAFGCLSLAGLGKLAVSERLLEQAEARTRHWVERASLDAMKFLRDNSAAHEALVAALLQRETLYGHEVAEALYRANSGPVALLSASLSDETPTAPQAQEPDHV